MGAEEKAMNVSLNTKANSAVQSGNNAQANLGNVRSVDTSHFAEAEQCLYDIAKLLGDFKLELDKVKLDMIYPWIGKGRNEFEKSYRVMVRKLDDQVDYTWELYETMLSSHEKFYLNDVETAKAMCE